MRPEAGPWPPRAEPARWARPPDWAQPPYRARPPDGAPAPDPDRLYPAVGSPSGSRRLPSGRRPASGLRKVLRDSALLTWRNVVSMRRLPDTLVTIMLQPIAFTLLFAYVFGGSLGGASYREFLVAGIFVQTVTFNAAFTSVGLANDLHRGIVERFRALPISRLAVILGRTGSDLLVSVLTLMVISSCGLLVGWRMRGGPLDALAAYLLVLLFAFAVSWVGAWVGLLARSVEVAQVAGLIWLFPLTFVSSAFVSVERMPGGLRAIAEWSPVSAVAGAARGLFGNPEPPGLPQPHGWPAQHAALWTVVCSVAIVAVFLPLAVARYRRVASR